MSDTRSYAEGFEDGWKSVRPIAVLPMYTPKMTKHGKSDYEAGYAHGVEKAEKSLEKR